MAERTDIVCIRETQTSIKQSVKKLVEMKIEAHGLGKMFTVLDQEIRSCLGGTIIFQGMQNHTAESIKSLEDFRIAYIEEAQSLSQHSLDLLRPTIRWEDKSRGLTSEIWAVWNPDKPTDPIDALLRGETPPEDSAVVSASYNDNPMFPDVLRKEMEYDKRRDPDKYAWIWLGQYRQNSEARVFKNWKIEEFTRPEGTVRRQGADWGFSIDPSVLVSCDIEGNRLYIEHEAYMVGCEIVNLPDLFRGVPESEKWFITADSARPETISYMQKHGFPKINSAIKGKKSVEEGIAFLQSFDIIVHPRCKHVIDELSLFSYRTDPLTGTVLPILQDRRNHTIDSLRYACEGARRAGVKPKEEKKVVRVKYPQSWMAA